MGSVLHFTDSRLRFLDTLPRNPPLCTMPVVRLSSKNQIVLPREAREAMGLKGREELLVVVKNGVTIILPKPAAYVTAVSGLGKGTYSARHLERERRSWQKNRPWRLS